jgi:TusA-related sulfurtransferase
MKSNVIFISEQIEKMKKNHILIVNSGDPDVIEDMLQKHSYSKKSLNEFYVTEETGETIWHWCQELNLDVDLAIF